jgi:hypothetical protein
MTVSLIIQLSLARRSDPFLCQTTVLLAIPPEEAAAGAQQLLGRLGRRPSSVVRLDGTVHVSSIVNETVRWVGVIASVDVTPMSTGSHLLVRCWVQPKALRDSGQSATVCNVLSKELLALEGQMPSLQRGGQGDQALGTGDPGIPEGSRQGSTESEPDDL